MSDLYTLRTSIANDLNRSNMSDRIDQAINSAIKHYSTDRFWFSETIDTFDTIAGTRAYTTFEGLPADILDIDVAKINISGTYTILRRMSFPYIEAVDTNPSSYGQPSDYSWYGRTLYLYSIPDNIYTVTLDFKKSYDELVNDADTNDFCVEAKDLIEARAKWIIYRSYLKDIEMMQVEKDAEMNALLQLTRKSEQLSTNNLSYPQYL